MYDKILVPTDGSEGAEVAVSHAIEIAEKFNSEVHTVYVVDIRADSTGDIMANMMGEFQKVGEKATAKIAEKIRSEGLKAVTDVGPGIPHKEINNYVEENDIDLIVMGTQGRTGIGRILMGSTTEKVVRTADVPVMTVKKQE